MQLFKKYCLLLVMLVMVACQQRADDSPQRVDELYYAAIRGEKAAFAPLRALANKGNADAQAKVGLLYDLGTPSVPKDKVQAASWYHKSAEQGEPYAQFFLGRMYRDGIGVPKDLLISYMWLNLAAAQGNENVTNTREALEKVMTPAQIAEGQKMSREWKPKL